MDPVKLDEDERNGLKRLAESFENLRGHMATAWNSAMVWVDNEMVFMRLNTLMVVAKDATDRIIVATARAEMNANKKLRSMKYESKGPHLEQSEKPVTPTEIVQLQAVHPNHRGRPIPLMTEGDPLAPGLRVQPNSR